MSGSPANVVHALNVLTSSNGKEGYRTLYEHIAAILILNINLNLNIQRSIRIVKLIMRSLR